MNNKILELSQKLGEYISSIEAVKNCDVGTLLSFSVDIKKTSDNDLEFTNFCLVEWVAR